MAAWTRTVDHSSSRDLDASQAAIPGLWELMRKLQSELRHVDNVNYEGKRADDVRAASCERQANKRSDACLLAPVCLSASTCLLSGQAAAVLVNEW